MISRFGSADLTETRGRLSLSPQRGTIVGAWKEKKSIKNTIEWTTFFDNVKKDTRWKITCKKSCKHDLCHDLNKLVRHTNISTTEKYSSPSLTGILSDVFTITVDSKIWRQESQIIKNLEKTLLFSKKASTVLHDFTKTSPSALKALFLFLTLLALIGTAEKG